MLVGIAMLMRKPGPKSETTHDGRSEASSCDGSANRKFIRLWLLPLGLLATLFSVGAYIMVQPIVRNTRPSAADGALMLLYDAEFNARGNALYSPTADVDVRLREGGYGAYMLVSVDFQGATEGAKWYLVASDQYGPPIDADYNAFCSRAELASWTSPQTLSCPDDGGDGDTDDVIYRWDDELGVARSGDGQIGDLVAFDGYNKDHVVIVSGTISKSGSARIRIWMPVDSPRLGFAGFDVSGTYGPIGYANYGDYASNEPIASLRAEDLDTRAEFAIRTSRQPVDALNLNQTSFTSELLDKYQLERANPVTEDPDVLHWKSADGGLPSMSFYASDPAGLQSSALRSFLAGVLVSSAITAIFLIIERAIEARAARG